ncbi:MAG: ribonuclease HI family protein [Myxococcaceae bacterium]|nr:ribonuclease HI family protein [Myxococcaceae bacterium]
MPVSKDAEILRHIAREEPLSSTQAAFGVTREQLTRILEKAARQLEKDAPRRAASQSEVPAVPEMPRLRVYSDGAARGNPGPAGAGAVLVEPNGQVVDRIGKYLGKQTNNFAEYMGLILGLERAQALGVKEIEVYADSELMIRQLGGRYQVKSPSLRPLYDRAVTLLNHFDRVKLVHVPREMNLAADEMSNRAIDEHL